MHQRLPRKVLQRLLKPLPYCVCHVIVERKPIDNAAIGIANGGRKPTRSRRNETDLYRTSRVAAARSRTRRPDGARPSLPGEGFLSVHDSVQRGVVSVVMRVQRRGIPYGRGSIRNAEELTSHGIMRWIRVR